MEKLNHGKIAIPGSVESGSLILLTSDGKAVILSHDNQTNEGYLNVVDSNTGVVLKTTRLAGEPVSNVHATLTPDQRLVLALSHITSLHQSFLDVIEVSSGRSKGRIKLLGDLSSSSSIGVTPDGKVAVIATAEKKGGYINIVDLTFQLSTNPRVKSLTLSGPPRGNVLISSDGSFAAISSASKNVDLFDLKEWKLVKRAEQEEGESIEEVVAEVLGKSVSFVESGKIKTLKVESRVETGKKYQPPTTSITIPTTQVVQTTTSTTLRCAMSREECRDICVKYCQKQDKELKDCIYDQTQCSCIYICGEEKIATTTTTSTTTAQVTSTTTVAKCGDGVLNHRYTAGGGEEECEPGVVECPSGLTCVDCHCVGCGDGRLQSGEECDPNNKKVRIDGKDLWDGEKYECSGKYEYCTSNCTCKPSIECGSGLYDSSDCDGECDAKCEECKQYRDMPCYTCAKKDCSEIDTSPLQITLYNSYEECVKHCNDPDLGYCKQYDKCDHCWFCYLYECGNGVVEPGEECENDLDCEDISIYLSCNLADCLCYPDCEAYCDDQGKDGYQWVNKQGGPAPNVDSKKKCRDWAQQKLQQIKKDCFTSCVASAYMEHNGVSCCCVDWNSIPCKNCPGTNPQCPPADPDCLDTL